MVRLIWLFPITCLVQILHAGALDDLEECGSNGSSETCPTSSATSTTSWTLRLSHLEAVIRRAGIGLAWGPLSWRGAEACEDTLNFGPLFALRLRGAKGGSRTLTSEHCSLVKHDADIQGTKFTAVLSCQKGSTVEWSAHMEELGQGLGATLRVVLLISGLQVLRVATLLLHGGSCMNPQSTGSVDGSPVSAGKGRFFIGMEHPLAKHSLGAETTTWGRAYSLVAEVSHLGELPSHMNLAQRYGAAIVSVDEPSLGRRAFAEYIWAARPAGAWQGPLVHYNSWYDFTSWQDEGFFSRPEYSGLLAQLRKEPMSEAGALQRVAAFEELTDRGVKLDSFLWDDGWDDPHALWTFDREKFPRGFKDVAARAQRLGAGLSVWLSPWGGYGQAKEERLRLGRKQGFETNDNGFSLAGQRYATRFKEAVQEFRRTARVNMFKFDGVAGDPAELSTEIEAMLCIVKDIREESHNKSESCDATNKSEKKDALWINLTTGTWPSPFFLLWVDSIWRGLTDTNVPDWPSVRGLSVRQRWQVWRECVVHELVVKRAALFPISRLMVHGAVLAGHGDALANGLHALAPHDWAQEVWSLAAMGLQLQELYVSAKFMLPWSWDEMATALQWARDNWEVLQDAHWAIPAGCIAAQKQKAFLPYAMAAYRGNSSAGTGFLLLRNPRNKAQSAPTFSLTNALELPASESGRRFALEVVRRASAANPAGAPLGCGSLGFAASEIEPGRCSLPADAQVKFKLDAGEMAVLRASLEKVEVL